MPLVQGLGDRAQGSLLLRSLLELREHVGTATGGGEDGQGLLQVYRPLGIGRPERVRESGAT